MADAFGASRVKVTPPEKGVFPLDHDGECKDRMKEFLDCLKKNKQDHYPCKDLSKGYLQCRMDHALMAKEDLSTLGFGEGETYVRGEFKEGEKEAEGFVAGTGVRGSKGKWLPWI
jgi:cytochrome c oxidase assembly protein subunit 19